MSQETWEVDATAIEVTNGWRIKAMSLWAEAWCAEALANCAKTKDGAWMPDRVRGEIVIRAMLDAGMILRREE